MRKAKKITSNRAPSGGSHVKRSPCAYSTRGVGHAFAVDGERRGSRVEGDQSLCPGGEVTREQSGARCQLEHDAGQVEIVDRGLEAGGLLEPSDVALGAKVVDAAPIPDIVVLRSSVLVVPALVLQDLLDLSSLHTRLWASLLGVDLVVAARRVVFGRDPADRAPLRRVAVTGCADHRCEVRINLWTHSRGLGQSLSTRSSSTWSAQK